MKTIRWLGGLAALTLATAASGAALAQTPPQGPPPGPPRAGPPPAGDQGGPRGRFGRFRASPEQVKQRNAERFAKMDANRDGSVTFDEFRGFLEARRLERQRQAFSRLTDGKNVLTLGQLNERADRFMQGPGGRRGLRGPGPGGFGGDDRGR
jgi:hypothetical protein